MPAKPAWYSRINEIITHLEGSQLKFVHRGMVESLFQTGRRRAQQILSGCPTRKFGGNVIAEREDFIAYLRAIAAGDDVHYEQTRRQKVAETLAGDRAQPRVLVEAPAGIVNQRIDELTGITLEPGRIVVQFESPYEGLRRLLALAMAIGNDQLEYEHRVSLQALQPHT